MSLLSFKPRTLKDSNSLESASLLADWCQLSIWGFRAEGWGENWDLANGVLWLNHYITKAQTWGISIDCTVCYCTGAHLSGSHIASIDLNTLELLQVSNLDDREKLLSAIYEELHPPKTTSQKVDSLLGKYQHEHSIPPLPAWGMRFNCTLPKPLRH